MLGRSKIKKLIDWAKKYHQENPYDAAHDLEHHHEVVLNVKKIVKDEKLGKKINLDVILVAAWWHDVARTDLRKNNRLLRKVSQELRIDNKFVDKVIKTINVHEYGKKQSALGEKVLYDADKIEYASYKRGTKVIQALEKGLISIERIREYQETWEKVILDVRKSLHFDSSRKMFDRKFLNIGRKLDKHHGHKDFWEIWYNVYHEFEALRKND